MMGGGEHLIAGFNGGNSVCISYLGKTLDHFGNSTVFFQEINNLLDYLFFPRALTIISLTNYKR